MLHPIRKAARPVPQPSRRGAVLIAVIVCVAVITLICGALMRLSMSESQQTRALERQLQATWLAESALERASAQLAAASDYAGETWELTAKELGGQWNATITISVDKLDGEPNRRLVHVRADYPNEPRWRVRQSKRIQMQLTSEPTGAKP